MIKKLYFVLFGKPVSAEGIVFVYSIK